MIFPSFSGTLKSTLKIESMTLLKHTLMKFKGAFDLKYKVSNTSIELIKKLNILNLIKLFLKTN